MWLRLLAERRFREGEKRPSEYLVMLPQSGSWAFGVKTLMGVSHSSKIGRANPVPILYSERPPTFDCVSSCVRTCLVPRSVVPRPAFAKKYRDWIEKHASATDICGFGKIQMKRRHRNRHAIWSNTMQRFFKILNALPESATSPLYQPRPRCCFSRNTLLQIYQKAINPVILGLFRNTYHYLKAHCAIDRNKIINFVLIYFTPNH